MSTVLIALHVIAAIALIGPVMVSTSTFAPRIPTAQGGDSAVLGTLNTLAGITNTYGMFSALVPILGIGIFLSNLDAYSTQGQFHAAIAVSIIAWALLLFLIAPRQKAVVTALTTKDSGVDLGKSRSQLAMLGGVFNLLWIICAVLMFL